VSRSSLLISKSTLCKSIGAAITLAYDADGTRLWLTRSSATHDGLGLPAWCSAYLEHDAMCQTEASDLQVVREGILRSKSPLHARVPRARRLHRKSAESHLLQRCLGRLKLPIAQYTTEQILLAKETGCCIRTRGWAERLSASGMHQHDPSGMAQEIIPWPKQPTNARSCHPASCGFATASLQRQPAAQPVRPSDRARWSGIPISSGPPIHQRSACRELVPSGSPALGSRTEHWRDP
jgi:hypothetical protein